MTDKEPSLAFVERMERVNAAEWFTFGPFSEDETKELLRLAKTAALIDEYKIDILAPSVKDSPKIARWRVGPLFGSVYHNDLHTAVRTMTDKSKEQSKSHENH